MVVTPILAMPDFIQSFIIEVDAFGFGLGGRTDARPQAHCLLQSRFESSRPIAYYSHVFSPRGRLKSIYEKELMAIVFSVKKGRHYLLGQRFMIRTDKKSLKFIMEKREVGAGYH